MANLNTLDVFFSSQSFHEEELRKKVVVVVDVLRASSTIITALMNHAKGIIPVEDMGEASRISQSVDSENILLCGEKDGVKIEGYDLGNSPFEYSESMIENKTLIFNTTNGTKAIKKAVGASQIYIGSFLNLSTIVHTLKSEEKDIVLVCAGWRGRMAIEDLLFAGNVVYNLSDGALSPEARDGAKVAFGLYDNFRGNLPKVIHSSNHAVRLKNIAGEKDIDYCAQTDICDILPVLNDGIISNLYG
ncbi:MAG: 2-phosphosulfolactate phosphatase [Bacteroidetes bacterium]|jgi:2-phosphosulfolactate phosphatase|nr:2-phosphosulfolactate phosphatase [Bacteroidota bacterium]